MTSSKKGKPSGTLPGRPRSVRHVSQANLSKRRLTAIGCTLFRAVSSEKPSATETLECTLMRSDNEAVVVNLDPPAVE